MVLEQSSVGRGKWFPLFLKYTARFSMEFPTGTTADEVLTVVQDPAGPPLLSPLVTSIVPDKERGEHDYIIKEKLAVLWGLVTWEMSYKYRWMKLPSGYRGNVDVGWGTNLMSEVRVREEEDTGVVVFTEDVTIETPTPFLPYIKKTMVKSHLETQDNLVEKILENRKLRLQVSP